MTADLASLTGIEVPTGLLIGGEWRPGSAGTLGVTDPATEDTLVEIANGTPEDAIAAVAAAHAALPGWAATPPRQRAECLRRAWALMIERSEAIARLMVLENGKALRDARGEVTYAAEFFRWFAEEAVRIDGSVVTAPSGANRILVLRQPVGVSVLVTPWNFPAAMATRKIGPALAAGCTVVLKPAKETPLTAFAVAAILSEAGVPDGVVNVVVGSSAGPMVSAMLADPRVRKLSFTGSTEVGRVLLRTAAETVTNCSMELGGNAPFLVFEDADIDAAIEGAFLAKMRNGGEACTAANRFYVHDKVADEFTAKFAARLEKLSVGPGLEEGTDLGPLVNEDTRSKVATLVAEAADTGAPGGHRRPRPGPPRLLLPAHRPGGPPDLGHPRHRDLRAGGPGGAVHRRGGGDPLGQRHRVRPGLLPLHRRPAAGAAGQRGAGDRHGRRQPRHRVRPGGAVRRRQAVRAGTGRGPRRAAGVHRDEVCRRRVVTGRA